MPSGSDAIRFVRWLMSALFMFGTAPTFFFIWMAWRIVTIFHRRSVYEAGDDFLYSLYQKLVLFFFENLSGVEVILYGDVADITKCKENVVFMCNHQSTVDWMVADMVAVRQGSIGHIRYILKDSLKYLPLYGFYFRQHSCIYVKRSGKFQKDQAETQLDILAQNKTPFWMVIFPEGHRYNPDNASGAAKNKEFAEQNGLPTYEHLFTPRPKALHLCIERLKANMDAIYDVTIAYSSSLHVEDKSIRTSAPPLTAFLNGTGQTIHIHIKRLDKKEVPSETKAFEEWLYERFSAKDQLLKNFYHDSPTWGTLGPGGRSNRLPLHHTLPAFFFWSVFNIPLWLTWSGLSTYLVMCVVSTVVSLFLSIFFI